MAGEGFTGDYEEEDAELQKILAFFDEFNDPDPDPAENVPGLANEDKGGVRDSVESNFSKESITDQVHAQMVSYWNGRKLSASARSAIPSAERVKEIAEQVRSFLNPFSSQSFIRTDSLTRQRVFESFADNWQEGVSHPVPAEVFVSVLEENFHNFTAAAVRDLDKYRKDIVQLLYAQKRNNLNGDVATGEKITERQYKDRFSSNQSELISYLVVNGVQPRTAELYVGELMAGIPLVPEATEADKAFEALNADIRVDMRTSWSSFFYSGDDTDTSSIPLPAQREVPEIQNAILEKVSPVDPHGSSALVDGKSFFSLQRDQQRVFLETLVSHWPKRANSDPNFNGQRELFIGVLQGVLDELVKKVEGWISYLEEVRAEHSVTRLTQNEYRAAEESARVCMYDVSDFLKLNGISKAVGTAYFKTFLDRVYIPLEAEDVQPSLGDGGGAGELQVEGEELSDKGVDSLELGLHEYWDAYLQSTNQLEAFAGMSTQEREDLVDRFISNYFPSRTERGGTDGKSTLKERILQFVGETYPPNTGKIKESLRELAAGGAHDDGGIRVGKPTLWKKIFQSVEEVYPDKPLSNEGTQEAVTSSEVLRAEIRTEMQGHWKKFFESASATDAETVSIPTAEELKDIKAVLQGIVVPVSRQDFIDGKPFTMLSRAEQRAFLESFANRWPKRLQDEAEVRLRDESFMSVLEAGLRELGDQCRRLERGIWEARNAEETELQKKQRQESFDYALQHVKNFLILNGVSKSTGMAYLDTFKNIRRDADGYEHDDIRADSTVDVDSSVISSGITKKEGAGEAGSDSEGEVPWTTELADQIRANFFKSPLFNDWTAYLETTHQTEAFMGMSREERKGVVDGFFFLHDPFAGEPKRGFDKRAVFTGFLIDS